MSGKRKKVHDKIIWITWEHHQRNRSICDNLGVPLFVYEPKLPRMMRYLLSVWWTIKVLIRERPGCVIVQNPSIMLACLAHILKYPFGYIVIMDAHNSGISPMEGKNTILNAVSIFLQRSMAMTLVTNELLSQKVLNNGGRPFILPDPLPAVRECPSVEPAGAFSVLVVCSFRADEPFNEILKAAALLPERYRFYFTGNYKRAGLSPERFPEVTFLGYVDDDRYWGYLKGCSVVVDITTRDDCLVCGAYEGIAVGKPVILSDTPVNKWLFRLGCIYSGPTPEDIARSVRHASETYTKLLSEIREMKMVLNVEWEKYKSDLMRKIRREMGVE